MPRFLMSVALALLAFAPAGQAQGPGNFPGMPPGGATNAGTCGGCNREFTWSGGTANAPKRCPHCNTRFGYVENADGTRTNLGVGITSGAGIAKLVIFAIIVVCVVIGGLAKLIGVLVSGGSARPKRKKAKKRRPVVEEDDDEDDAPPRKSDLPRADAKPKPKHDDDDDAGFEVIGDAPPPPTPAPTSGPPRRAKARLLPPGGAP